MTALNSAASNLGMPALSPTMTEGGISSWKLKEGDSFSAGDVILEIETDKAQMAVEAQDDGILVKIYKQDGDKEIKVGTSIGVIAEPEDDISSLEIPAPVDMSAAAAPAAPAPAPAPAKKEPTPPPPPPSPPAQPKKSTGGSTSAAGAKKADPAQVLFPSVLGLLEASHISVADALEKIPASGPKGRILKGDVLAYLGSISAGSIDKLNKVIKEREHLDLSNIKIAEKKKVEKEEKVEKKVEKPKVVENFYELLTFNPPRPVVKKVLRSPEVIEIVVSSPKPKSTPPPPAEAEAAPAVEPVAPVAQVHKKKTVSRLDQIFYDLVDVPKSKSL
ncbi:hypothetical protein BZA70DRAFT_278947 [Myxozyma melibiosi]|uniref:Pyruvate dehydrogenase protein x component n=1 Tax=Myxozyma melibiosi TaxID=54550 RepID=A0ABR1F5B8_9ASCO